MIKLILSTILAVSFTVPAWAVKTRFVHMGRNFTLVKPKSSSKLPLVVLLHGCKQTPDLILNGTYFEELAEKKKFIVLAPEQPSFANGDNCWNWFLHYQQIRNSVNEMGQIVSAIQILATQNLIDQNKVFVTGISAGGAFAHNLAVCYPDVFAGSAIHSGLAYKTAETLSEAQTVLTTTEQKSPDLLGKKMSLCARNGTKHKLNRMLVIHGESDRVVPTLHAELITSAEAVWRDYLDDGRRNDSVRGNSHSWSDSYQSGYVITTIDTQYPSFLERRMMVKGLQHAWGGGKPLTVHFDPDAPSSSEIILNFFGLNK